MLKLLRSSAVGERRTQQYHRRTAEGWAAAEARLPPVAAHAAPVAALALRAAFSLEAGVARYEKGYEKVESLVEVARYAYDAHCPQVLLISLRTAG